MLLSIWRKSDIFCLFHLYYYIILIYLCKKVLCPEPFYNVSKNENICETCLEYTKEGVYREKDHPQLHLTISSLIIKCKNKTKVDRLLELSWFNLPDEMIINNQTWVALFNRVPTNYDDEPLERVYINDLKTNYYKTGVRFPKIKFSSDNLTSECLGYWAALGYGLNIVYVTCIKAHPFWMYDLKDYLWQKPLMEIFIPGSHNAGSFCNLNRIQPYIFPVKYVFCQDEDIWTQLVYGIRFLDIRVTYRIVSRECEEYWICHGSVRVNVPIRNVLSDVKKFVMATNEIIIIDFHIFSDSFYEIGAKRRHYNFMQLIKYELDPYMIDKSLGSDRPLIDYWNTDKRILVTYGSIYAKNTNEFFPGVKHLWPNVDKVPALSKYLCEVLSLKYNKIVSTMAELTPKPKKVVYDAYDGARAMANKVNQCISFWFENFLWQNANIVATDFFLGNTMIDVAINSNIKKALIAMNNITHL